MLATTLSFGQNGVYLIDEDHAGWLEASHSKQGFHQLLTFAHPFGRKRTRRKTKECASALCCNSFGEHCLTISWRPIKQNASIGRPDPRKKWRVQLGVDDVFDEGLFDVLKALNIRPFDAWSLIQNCVNNSIDQLLVQFREGLPALILILDSLYISLGHTGVLLLTDLRLLSWPTKSSIIILRSISSLFLGWLSSAHIIWLSRWPLWIKLTLSRRLQNNVNFLSQLLVKFLIVLGFFSYTH